MQKNLAQLAKMRIYKVTTTSEHLTKGLEILLPQLSSSAQMPTTEYLENMLLNEHVHLFVAEHNSAIVGMLTLAIVDIPTGRKAWIEDVVVDSESRGLNIGFSLVEKAKEYASLLGVKKIYLTSNPSRKAAHALYHKCGFEEYNTTVFRVKS